MWKLTRIAHAQCALFITIGKSRYRLTSGSSKQWGNLVVMKWSYVSVLLGICELFHASPNAMLKLSGLPRIHFKAARNAKICLSAKSIHPKQQPWIRLVWCHLFGWKQVSKSIKPFLIRHTCSFSLKKNTCAIFALKFGGWTVISCTEEDHVQWRHAFVWNWPFSNRGHLNAIMVSWRPELFVGREEYKLEWTFEKRFRKIWFDYIERHDKKYSWSVPVAKYDSTLCDSPMTNFRHWTRSWLLEACSSETDHLPYVSHDQLHFVMVSSRAREGSWTELNELNGGTRPRCPNWTERTFQTN